MHICTYSYIEIHKDACFTRATEILYIVCAFLHIYILYIHIHIRIYVYIYTYTYTYIHIIYIYIHNYTYLCKYDIDAKMHLNHA